MFLVFTAPMSVDRTVIKLNGSHENTNFLVSRLVHGPAHFYGNDYMEYLDCLRPFPRLDYDVREGQGAADWPTLTNSCYARPSPPLPEMLFASTLLLVGNVQCTFVMIHHGFASS